MGDGSWEFEAVEGTVSIGEGVVRIESRPGSTLARRLARWRESGLPGTVRFGATLLGAGFLLFGLAYYGYRLSRLGLTGLGVPAVFVVAGLLQSAVTLWQATRDTTIPVEDIESVTLDAERRKLVLDTGEDDRFLESLRWDDDDTTLRPLTEEDVRDARETFRLKGIPVSVDDSGDTETTYRVETRKGALFCEDCGSQVSPSDATCPACGYAIRVETDAESDDREERFEYSIGGE